MELINNDEIYIKIMSLSEKTAPLFGNRLLREQFEKEKVR